MNTGLYDRNNFRGFIAEIIELGDDSKSYLWDSKKMIQNGEVISPIGDIVRLNKVTGKYDMISVKSAHSTGHSVRNQLQKAERKFTDHIDYKTNDIFLEKLREITNDPTAEFGENVIALHMVDGIPPSVLIDNWGHRLNGKNIRFDLKPESSDILRYLDKDLPTDFSVLSTNVTVYDSTKYHSNEKQVHEGFIFSLAVFISVFCFWYRNVKIHSHRRNQNVG